MANKFKIKKGDTVKVLSGKDKGKSGKVIRVIPEISRVVIEGLNIRTRFEKSRKAGQPGKKVEFPSALAISKVMLVDSGTGQPTRVGYNFLENGKKQRISKKSGKAV